MLQNTKLDDDWIETRSGRIFWLPDVRLESIDITDIAHALSMTCRYSGHCNRFYSVARHSVEVAKTVPDYLKLAALLHDASEAYLTDIPSPFKDMLHGYREFEDMIQRVVYTRFEIDVDCNDPTIKEADTLALRREAPRLGFTWANPIPNDEGYVLPPSNPEDDKAAFMAAFYLYGGTNQ